MKHREMWGTIFGDTDKYVDFYFRAKANKAVVYSQYDEGVLVSMAFFSPCVVVYRGQECVCPYIVGVATSPQHRGKGIMATLLEQGLADAKSQGAPLAFLSPANPKIYEPLGFEGAYYRTQLKVKENQRRWYTAATFSRLDQTGKEQVAEFARAQLYASDLDLYMHRSVEYYELLHEEMKALDGRVIVLREGKFIRGVAAYVHEENFYEITEVICDPVNARKVMQSICAFLMERPDKAVVFSDGYFLSDVSGDGIEVCQMEEPYIMVKGLSEENQSGLRVYINDIT